MRVTSEEVAEQARLAAAAAEQPPWPFPRTMEETVAAAVEEATAALAEQRASMTAKVSEAVAAASEAAAKNRDRDAARRSSWQEQLQLHDPSQGYRSRG